MGKNAAEILKSKGKEDLYRFLPEQFYIAEDDPKNPLYDGRAKGVKEWLVNSILRRGVIHPVRFRRAGNDAEGEPIRQIVVGRKRVRATAEANRRLLEKGLSPILIRAQIATLDEDSLVGMMIEENEGREESTVIEKAGQAARAMERGMSKQLVADMFGVDPQTVTNWMQTLELGERAQLAISRGELPANAARILAPLPHAEQGKAVEKMIATGAVKGQGAIRAAKAAVRGEEPKAPERRMRSRQFVEKWVAELQPMTEMSYRHVAAVLGYVLGDDTALEGFPTLIAAAQVAHGGKAT